jgi:adenosylcobinamide kinase/adenosylcobinamide-phosphate guanylyltransferase
VGELILVGGGVRSGKSAFALARAERAPAPRYFIATAEAWDDEMQARIERHRRERGERFATLEAPCELERALAGAPAAATVIIDCLTLWLSNLLAADLDDTAIERRVDALVAVARARTGATIVVTNEVGMGVVPPSALGRRFRDLAGRAHQLLAQGASEIYLAALGTVLALRPSPLEAARPAAARDGTSPAA